LASSCWTSKSVLSDNDSKVVSNLCLTYS
jgi:hypothetical protein